jgi:tetratricopeptide (TPR) repeat protein
LAIDPNCAEAYYARGNLLRLVVGDWAAAKSDYAKAVALDPHSDAGEYAQGYIFDLKGAMSGRFDEFFDWARRRLERDPLDTDTMWELAGNQQLLDGHLEESAATHRRLLELNPAYAFAWGQYGSTLLYMGRNAEALAAAQKETDSAFRLALSAGIYWAMNRRAESDAALGALERGFADRNQYQIASVHAYRGEADAAFTWLDRAYQQKRGSLEYLKVDPPFRKLHGDPRFDAFLRKVKLVE